jgi:hypothetical protein
MNSISLCVCAHILALSEVYAVVPVLYPIGPSIQALEPDFKNWRHSTHETGKISILTLLLKNQRLGCSPLLLLLSRMYPVPDDISQGCRPLLWQVWSKTRDMA